MRITIERDEQILKDGEPEIQIISIERKIGTSLDDILPLLEDCLCALGHRLNGNLVIEIDWEQLS
jgi:hypothetical protein